jgi:hypothetical protein
VLEFAKEVLNEVAGFIELPVILPRGFTATPRRNDNLDSGLLQRFDHAFLGVISLVCDHRSGLDIREENLRSGQIVDLAGGQEELGRVPQGIDPSMNFGRQTATRATDRLVRRVSSNRATAVLMGSNQSAVDHHIFLIGILGQKG